MIVPHLWFDKEAKEAAEFYCSVFSDSIIKYNTILPDTAGGDCETVSFTLSGHPFQAISAGPMFRFNPSISFILNFDPSRDERPFITPTLMFVGNVCGKAEEAGNHYLSVFRNTDRGLTARYPEGMEPDQEGAVMYSDFLLENQWFVAMDSAQQHDFVFNEAVSFMVYCDTQEDVDHYWQKLSAMPEAEQCGWLKDRYGLSWQIVPRVLDTMM